MRYKELLASAAVLSALTTPAFADDFHVEETTIPQLEQAFRDHRVTCHEVVERYLDRIAADDKHGTKINATLPLNPTALATADKLDAAFAQKGTTGPLYCVPVGLKDNYDTADL